MDSVGESMKRILDKILGWKLRLSGVRKTDPIPLNLTQEIWEKDFMMLSKNVAVDKISRLLRQNRKVICELKDRDGKIGQLIIDIDNNIQEDFCQLLLKDRTKYRLEDKFLYNIIWNPVKNQHSLEEGGEYFEKIEHGND